MVLLKIVGRVKVSLSNVLTFLLQKSNCKVSFIALTATILSSIFYKYDVSASVYYPRRLTIFLISGSNINRKNDFLCRKSHHYKHYYYVLRVTVYIFVYPPLPKMYCFSGLQNII